MEVIHQQVEGRVRIGEARARSSALSLDQARLPEQPGAPEEREEDDRGCGGALESLVAATAPRGRRSRMHRRLVLGPFGGAAVVEGGVDTMRAVRRAEHGR